VFANTRIDLNTRIAAAMACLPYEKPRLIAMVRDNTNPNETRLVITGGLPRLPGTDTTFPGDPPAPQACPTVVEATAHERAPIEADIGTCTVKEAAHNQHSVK
jgi:hypothetical protein